MSRLPASPDLDHLRKQAKQLLRAFRFGDGAAIARFRATLPAAQGRSAAFVAGQPYRLHDSQSVLAREHGFRSWLELKRHVDWCRSSEAERRARWLELIFSERARERTLSLRMLEAEPGLALGPPWLACLTGDAGRLAAALDSDPDFASRPAGPYAMPPLALVANSQLIWEPAFASRLLASARLLIDRGADVDGRWTDPRYPDNPLSVLYGAAGRTHHPGMTQLLLEAGADPNDNESLYHAMESSDPACARLLLEAGARVAGTNAIGRALDYDRIDGLRLLLSHGSAGGEGHWLHHAIRRGRSKEHVAALIAAGVDNGNADRRGRSAYRLARLFGREDVAELLEQAGTAEPLSQAESFVAACSRADEAAARAFLRDDPGLIAGLEEGLLTIMPQLAAIGRLDAVRTMLALGWPREVKTAWQATALNLAIFAGDAAMTRLLLESGADWQTRHGYGDNALGTLSFASQADDLGEPAPGDHAGCAEALLDHGVPPEQFRRYRFSDEVQDLLDARSASED
ncbi:ankyrin repeat domain-containing protein [Bosea beijingensis]|uniref:ankyrin repeat domain-containing protein n=1 Tax=Bosea beijingensis TaxID=3068632 RepID=UPI002741F866|nr:hypothetical protein [Bosea sp. REN20]